MSDRMIDISGRAGRTSTTTAEVDGEDVGAPGGDGRALVGDVLRAFKFSAGELAPVLRVAPDTVAAWVDGQETPTRAVRQQLEPLARLGERLQETFEPGDVHRWLHTRNRYLEGATPAAVLSDGEVDRVAGALDVMDWGIYL